MKCFVYRNLHKQGCVYSIKALEGLYAGRVVGYASHILMINVEMRVSQSGRARALKERQRNVHAGLIGEVVCVTDFDQRLPNTLKQRPVQLPEGMLEITYNPWKYCTFVYKDSTLPIESATCVNIQQGSVQAGNYC